MLIEDFIKDLGNMSNFTNFGKDKSDYYVDKIWGVGKAEEDWNNDNDKSDLEKSDYERNYEDNRARQYE
jgi:hypothetical protein